MHLSYMNMFNPRCIVLLFCLLWTMQETALSQVKKKIVNHAPMEFKNQGEQEEYWAKQLFIKSYKPMNFDRFKDKIIVNGSVYTFGNENITISEEVENYNLIFKNGLLYPGIFNGNVNTKILNESEVKELTEQQRVLYNLGRTDNIIISAFEECKFLNSNFKQRRFKFWLTRQGMLNPTVYFLELTNEKANRRTSLQSFLQDAKLTFFKEGWIVL